MTRSGLHRVSTTGMCPLARATFSHLITFFFQLSNIFVLAAFQSSLLYGARSLDWAKASRRRTSFLASLETWNLGTFWSSSTSFFFSFRPQQACLWVFWEEAEALDRNLLAKGLSSPLSNILPSTRFPNANLTS